MPKLIGTGLLAVLTAAALLASGSQAFASHVACGDVITQDTTLDGDLVDCPGSGIVIGASDITLDLGGHTVDGGGAGWEAGVGNAGHDRVTVKNGIVREFHVGVELQQANDNALLGLRIRDPRTRGIVLSELSGALVEGNVVTSLGSGILLYGERITVRRNVFTRNGHGIQAFDAGDNRIEENIVSGNRGDGFHGFGGGSTLIQRNLIVANGGAGISTDDGSTANRIEDNRIWDNGGAGVFMYAGAHGNRVKGNSVLRNRAGGIFLGYGNGNEIASNRISRNGGDGIYLSPEADGNVVRRNFTLRNADDGVDSDSGSTTIVRNVGVRNGDLGIEAEPGVTDGGGNRAAANGNPLQCLNVPCR